MSVDQTIDRGGAGFHPLRYLRRLVALAALAGAVLVLWLVVSPILPDRYAWQRFASNDAATAPAQTTAAALPARPSGVPARIPPWAWKLHTWLSNARQGPRPKAAPHHVPAWFWDWRKWRLAVESH